MENTKSKRKFLIIHTDKETGEYDRFEIYPERFVSLEVIKQKLADWNNSETAKTKGYLYEDQLLCAAFEDAKSSFKKETFIREIKSICRDIQYNIENLDSWTESIEDFLKELKEDEEDV